ncbi:unnamed protein product [Adineta steineri]|uniref:Helicase C-terminal domain-containing protein n=1 Tax=Adineta steineri TaxID=433720 RepID=A0A814JJU1_9BILA|nr:unnamed protein product [Adineta steineri]CAF1039326.1 unnamed protein product [Adineta steineri]CAF3754937.1 unnamed protein product [Adineta steineri]CAF3908022.1 unnamed protein product [Adineta steineri]
MAQFRVSSEKTNRIVGDLENLFSNQSNRQKLESFIPDLPSVEQLLSKLPDMITKYERHGNGIDNETNFFKLLQNFKNIIEDNIKMSIYGLDTNHIIDNYVSAIQQNYELFIDYGQTLEELNKMIAEQSLPSKNKKEICTLIIRGTETKIPDFIYFDSTNPNDHEKKLAIIKKFYAYFIENICYVRESSHDMLKDDNYRLKLKKLQSKLLRTDASDIKQYFVEIKLKIIQNPGYSTEVLFEYLAENEMMHNSVSNNSEFYWQKFIEMFRQLSNKKCIESLSYLVFKLQKGSFIELITEIVENHSIFKSIYDKGIQLFLNEYQMLTNPTVNRLTNDFVETKKRNVKELEDKFKDLFLYISSKRHILTQLRNLIIDEENSKGTYDILGNIYGQRIKSIDLTDKIVNVKYCFNYYFFKSLSYDDLYDVKNFTQFIRLLFYIHTCNDDDKLNITNDAHHGKLLDLKKKFLKVDNDKHINHFDDLVEMLKTMIKIESFQFRLDCAKSIISDLEEHDTIHVKAKVLEKFFNSKNYSDEIILRLAKSLNIDVLKYISADEDIIISKLCDCNPNFKSLVNYLEKPPLKFNIKDELTPGFNIPNDLSLELANDDNYNHKNKDYTEEKNGIIMSILFKVFNCSSNNDKEVFLKNKDSINKEFMKLYESVKQLIQFYSSNGNDNINTKLRDQSIQHILNGFSRTYQESLDDRNKHARTIIDNFINYKFDEIKKIAESTRSDAEILYLFDKFMERKIDDTLNDWKGKTSQLHDKIYFLYCYHKYKETDFDKWYKESNANKGYEIIKNNRAKIKKDLRDNEDAFKKIGIDYLQHNQVGALALIHDYLTDELKTNRNLFIKIGTGQGKSLAIAEAARRVVQANRSAENPKVFVITCYNHLAERDHKNFQAYYNYFRIETMHCTSSSSTEEFCRKDVIYADLETYFGVLRKEGHNKLTKGTAIHLPNIKNAVLIMDEFDSLILDSDELRQYVHDFDVELTNSNVNFDKKADIEQFLDKNFIKKCDRKFNGIFTQWWNTILTEKKKEKENTFQDSLGKNISLAGSFLNKLKKKKQAHFVHYYLDALVFYSQFKKVIGFSGSIEEKYICKFKQVFNNKAWIYHDIPPFFGSKNLDENRKCLNKLDDIGNDLDKFLNAIEHEIGQRYQEQPILIFADSHKENNENKSDYDHILGQLLKEQKKLLKDHEIIEIKTEDDIVKNIDKIGKLDSITLATRIIGRGADIKVHTSIEKGLHLILTYYPQRESIYTQMLGRTARQDEKGSYSEIVRTEKKFSPVEEKKVDLKSEIIHKTTEYFYRNYNPSSNMSNVALKWALFSELMRDLPEDEIKKHDFEQFVKTEFL